jgi:hypothetical protein
MMMKKFALILAIATMGIVAAEAQVRRPVDMRKVEIDLDGTNAASSRLELRGTLSRVLAVTEGGATSTVSVASDDGYELVELTNVTTTAVSSNGISADFVGLEITTENDGDTTNTVRFTLRLNNL